MKASAQRAGGGLKALLVVDAEGAFFARVGTLQLGVPIWRTTRDPVQLEESTLILLNADHAPTATRISEWVRCGPTIIATRTPAIAEALDALQCGAVGYVDITASDEALRRTLRGALQGEAAYQRSLLGVWLRSQRRGEDPLLVARLTERQRQIVQLIASGSTDRDIAARLGIRKATAQKHVANMLRRLRVRNRAEAVGVILGDPLRSSSVTRPGTPPR